MKILWSDESLFRCITVWHRRVRAMGVSHFQELLTEKIINHSASVMLWDCYSDECCHLQELCPFFILTLHTLLYPPLTPLFLPKQLGILIEFFTQLPTRLCLFSCNFLLSLISYNPQLYSFLLILVSSSIFSATFSHMTSFSFRASLISAIHNALPKPSIPHHFSWYCSLFILEYVKHLFYTVPLASLILFSSFSLSLANFH